MDSKQLIDAACRIAAKGAMEYLRVNHLTADNDVLSACLKSWVKAKWDEAMHDAKEALEANMGQVAESTFAAAMLQAGIEAAKEAGRCEACLSGGGWQCEFHQAQGVRKWNEQQATLASVAQSQRQAEIDRVCARHELESDEFMTAEQKAKTFLRSSG